MRVKICGITRSEDAVYAVNAGADALGFIFVRSSPRYITPEAARSIILALPPFVTPVGVFVNGARAEVLEVVEETGIRCLQLHGQETPDETEDFPVPVYKAFRVSVDFNPEILKEYHTTAYLLDTYVEGKDGVTGRIFDWKIATKAKRYGRIILGGGITPMNIADAIRIVSPYAIDVSSGVESSPGVKDRGKILQLFDAVKRAETEAVAIVRSDINAQDKS